MSKSKLESIKTNEMHRNESEVTYKCLPARMYRFGLLVRTRGEESFRISMSNFWWIQIQTNSAKGFEQFKAIKKLKTSRSTYRHLAL